VIRAKYARRGVLALAERPAARDLIHQREESSIVPQAVGLFDRRPADVDRGDDALLVGECEALLIGERVIGVGGDGDR